MNNTTNSWEEKARAIVLEIAAHEEEIRKMGFASIFLEAIEKSIISLLHDTEQSAREGKLYDDRELDVFIAQAKAEARAEIKKEIEKLKGYARTVTGSTKEYITALDDALAALSKE